MVINPKGVIVSHQRGTPVRGNHRISQLASAESLHGPHPPEADPGLSENVDLMLASRMCMEIGHVSYGIQYEPPAEKLTLNRSQVEASRPYIYAQQTSH